MPRSGTSWLSQIFDSNPKVSFKLSPLFSYEFKNVVNEYSSRQDWDNLFLNVINSKDEFINQTYRRVSGEYPFFDKQDIERLVIKDTRYHNLTLPLLQLYDDLKFVHIVRNPCGAINSWLSAPKEFPQDLNIFEYWRNGKCRKTGIEEFWGFDDWLLLTKKYFELESLYPKQVKVFFYDEIVKKPYAEVKSMFDYVGLELCEQTINFIKRSTSNHNISEYSVYKKKEVVDKWKKELHPLIIEEIKSELIGNKLDSYFDF